MSQACPALQHVLQSEGNTVSMTSAWQKQKGDGQAPMVSVIVPFFNSAEWLEETICSVLAQDFDDFDIVLVDDGSTDGSTALARSYADRYQKKIRYFEHDGHANKGVVFARNLGIRMTRGKYIAPLDADDFWEQRKLAEQIAIMEAHPEIGMVSGVVRYWSSWAGGVDRLVQSGHVLNQVVLPPEASLAVYPLGRADAPAPSDVLLRREAVASIGGFQEEFVGPVRLYEDQAFFSKLYLEWPVYFADAVWTKYRIHANSVMAHNSHGERYHLARGYFLNWFKHYLAARPWVDSRVSQSVRRARFFYKYRKLSRGFVPLYSSLSCVKKAVWARRA